MPRNLWLGALPLLLIHGAVVLADFIAPYPYAQQARTQTYAPPTPIRFVDEAGSFHLRPFIRHQERTYPIRFWVRGEPYRLLGLKTDLHLFGVEEPARIFLLGSDGFGRDQLSRLLHGGRISLFAGLLAAALSLGLGLVLGSLAGFYGRWTDTLVMRCSELFMSLPWLYLLLAARAFLPLSISPTEAFLLLVVLIGSIGWARPARLIRSVVLSVRERDFVKAARGFGAGDIYLLVHHVLPETVSVVLTQGALLVPRYILAEVALSFLGLGVAEPVPSWGNMLSEMQKYHVLASYGWMLAPGVVLVGVFLAYQQLARALAAEAFSGR